MQKKLLLESAAIAFVFAIILGPAIGVVFADWPNPDVDIEKSRGEYGTYVQSKVTGMPDYFNNYYQYGTWESSRSTGSAHTAGPMYYTFWKNFAIVVDSSTYSGYKYQSFTGGSGVIHAACRTKQRFQYGGVYWWLEAYAQILT